MKTKPSNTPRSSKPVTEIAIYRDSNRNWFAEIRSEGLCNWTSTFTEEKEAIEAAARIIEKKP